jgi:probable phosphoglycerate mutase
VAWPRGYSAGKRIYLVRHASAAPPGVLAGRADYALSAEGRGEAEELRLRLAGVSFGLAFSSPLKRALQTAAVLLGGPPAGFVLTLPELAEISLGRWEGRSKAWIREHYPVQWAARGRDLLNYPPPGGESLAELAARVLPVFDRIRLAAAAAPGQTLVVAHQAVNRVILARLGGTALEKSPDIPQPPCALTVIET